MRRSIALLLLVAAGTCWAAVQNFPKRWSSKPPVGVQINWGHPLANGLVRAWLMNEAGGLSIFDLVTAKTESWSSGGPSWVVKSGGIGLNFLSTSSVEIPLTAVPASGTTFSIAALVSWDGTNKSTYYGILNDETLPEGLYINSDLGQFSFYNSGGHPSGVNLTPGTVYSVIISVSGGNLSMYQDGVLVATAGSIFTATWNYIGGLPAVHALGGTVYGVKYWKRALTAAEAQQLYLDPYCFLQPMAPRIRQYSGFSTSATPPCLISVLGAGKC